MEHFYESIEGWFDFEDLYREAVKRVPFYEDLHQAQMVEVGVYKGRSCFFLAVEAFNSGKPIHVIAVDNFSMQGAGPAAFSKLRAAHGLTQTVSMIEATSVQASRQFEDATLDFVFLDADHSYDAVKADIAAWWPKVKPGGILAGHDHCEEFPGVGKALVEFVFQSAQEIADDGLRYWTPRSWWVDKK